MIVIEAKWYDGKRSAQVPVIVRVFDNGTVQVEAAAGGEILLRRSLSVVRVSDRLAGTPRFLNLPGGGVLETEDNRSVDHLLRKTHARRWWRWVHLLETRKRWVLTAGLTVLLIGAFLLKVGFPAAAQVITGWLPPSVFDLADRQTLAHLDRLFFRPSELPAELESRVAERLQSAAETHAPPVVRLLFRKGGSLGPNAFALPGGTVVFTDELVLLAEKDEELLGVLAHEIGHLKGRHAMRLAVQGSLVSFALLALTGDASGVSELFLGLPALLTQLGYSRGFENEADRHALAFLNSQGLSADFFADILERIDRTQRVQAQGANPWNSYLSTHPSTPERIRRFREAAAGD